MRRSVKLSVLIVASVMSGIAPVSYGQKSLSATVCSAQEYREFDFWLGDWDAFNAGDGALSAHVRVTSILNGCAVREEYSGIDGVTGESLSTYDPAHKLWEQYWVSSSGEIVSITGGFSLGAMVMTGPEKGARTSLVRGTWKPEATGVREIGERSPDGGRTWGPWFDLHFRHAHKQPATTP